jgi:hypothetical protein
LRPAGGINFLNPCIKRRLGVSPPLLLQKESAPHAPLGHPVSLSARAWGGACRPAPGLRGRATPPLRPGARGGAAAGLSHAHGGVTLTADVNAFAVRAGGFLGLGGPYPGLGWACSPWTTSHSCAPRSPMSWPTPWRREAPGRPAPCHRHGAPPPPARHWSRGAFHGCSPPTCASPRPSQPPAGAHGRTRGAFTSPVRRPTSPACCRRASTALASPSPGAGGVRPHARAGGA